jgi:hypothetical protein
MVKSFKNRKAWKGILFTLILFLAMRVNAQVNPEEAYREVIVEFKP